MKFALHTLLVGLLAIGPIGCNRQQTPEQSVSANADQTERTEKAAPTKTYRGRTETRRADERAAKPQPKNMEPRAETKPERKVQVTQNVPAGTALTVTLAEGISTETNKVGDTFTAHLTEPIIVEGKVVADKGDRVTGRIKELEEPGRVKGRARLELVLTEITTANHAYRLSTEPFTVVAGDNKDRDAAIIAGGAGAGAIIGAVTGGKKGAALGAIIGGGTGTTAVLITKGQQLELKPETRVNFVLSNDVDLPVVRSVIS